MFGIGIKIGLDGEKTFSSALKDINVGLKLLESEMRAVSSQFLDNNKSIEAYTAKNHVLGKQIDAQKEKIDKLKQILQKSTEMYGENDKKTTDCATKLNIAQAELNKMQNQLKLNNAELEKYSGFSEKTASSVGKLDKEIGTLKNELEGVDKKYKNNENSSEALGEKQKILSDIFGKQSEKVAALREALKNSENAFGKGSIETKKFEKALKDAEQELSGTERELKNVENAIQNAGNSTRTFRDMLKANLSAEAITAGIRKLADSAKNLKNYIMGGIQSSAGCGRKMSTVSEKTGISTEVLQKFSAAAKMTEVDVETFTKSYSKSIKSMSSVDFNAKNLNSMSKAYKTLGVNVRDSSGNLRDAQTVFWETIDGLKNMENETERNGVALQIFGKSAMELPLITRPLIKTQVTEIEGKDRDIIDYVGYSAYDKYVKIGLYGDYKIDEISKFFSGSGKVTFSNEPEKYYIAEIVEQIDFERFVKFRIANVKFHTQPFKYLVDERPVDTDITEEISEINVINLGIESSRQS